MPIAYGLVDISKPGKTQPAVCLTSDPESNDNNEESIESCEVCGSSSKVSVATLSVYNLVRGLCPIKISIL